MNTLQYILMKQYEPEISCQVYRPDPDEPNGRPGKVAINFSTNFVGISFIWFLLCSFILFVSRFEWPNGDKYTGQYINGKRNGLGDMQVGDIGDILGTVQDIKDIFSMVMAISTREPGEMVSTTGRWQKTIFEAVGRSFEYKNDSH